MRGCQWLVGLWAATRTDSSLLAEPDPPTLQQLYANLLPSAAGCHPQAGSLSPLSHLLSVGLLKLHFLRKLCFE